MKRVTLIGGYRDAQGNLHKEVEVGYVLRGADLFAIDEHPLGTTQAARDFLILGKAITKFGTMRLPVPPTVLAELDTVERDDLLSAYNELEEESRGKRRPEVLLDGRLRLSGGYEEGGITYDVVEYGNRLKGKDYITADQLDLKGARRACHLAGLQVSQLGQAVDYRQDFERHRATFSAEEQRELERFVGIRSNDAEVVAEAVNKIMLKRKGAPEYCATLPGPLSLEVFERLSIADLFAIQGAAELFRQSFRLPKQGVQEERDATNGVRPDAGDGTPAG
jgi:hypothetical protein